MSWQAVIGKDRQKSIHLQRANAGINGGKMKLMKKIVLLSWLIVSFSLAGCGISSGPSLVDRGSTNVESVPPVVTRIFVTSGPTLGGDLTNGLSNGMLGADKTCQDDPKASSLGIATVKALIVDGTSRLACTTPNCSGGSSEHLDWVLAPSTTYYEEDGATVIGVTNSSGIFVFNLSAPFGSANGHWTGLNADWTPHTDNCNGFTSQSFFVDGQTGDPTMVSSTAISDNSSACGPSSYYSLVCVEQ